MVVSKLYLVSILWKSVISISIGPHRFLRRYASKHTEHLYHCVLRKCFSPPILIKMVKCSMKGNYKHERKVQSYS